MLRWLAILLDDRVEWAGVIEGAIGGNAVLAGQYTLEEATEMTAYEDFVAEQVRGGATIIGLYPATKQENLDKFAAWRKANNR